MGFTNYLRRESIILDIEAPDKERALDEIVNILVERGVLPNKEPYLAALIDRERLCSTGIGRGTAIPHAKLKDIDNILLAFARSRKGVDFDSLDKQPVHFIFVIFTPENVPEDYLLLLAHISRLAKDEKFREAVMGAVSEDEIFEVFEEKDRELAKRNSG